MSLGIIMKATPDSQTLSVFIGNVLCGFQEMSISVIYMYIACPKYIYFSYGSQNDRLMVWKCMKATYLSDRQNDLQYIMKNDTKCPSAQKFRSKKIMTVESWITTYPQEGQEQTNISLSLWDHEWLLWNDPSCICYLSERQHQRPGGARQWLDENEMHVEDVD